MYVSIETVVIIGHFIKSDNMFKLRIEQSVILNPRFVHIHAHLTTVCRRLHLQIQA